jgi:hypothetical protein
MKIVNSLILAGAVLSLAACACPRQSDYYDTPYGMERTAGEGTAVYDGKCQKEAAPMKSAEPVFETKMHK